MNSMVQSDKTGNDKKIRERRQKIQRESKKRERERGKVRFCE